MKTTGSEIAKNGFINEKEVVDKINNWQTDQTVQGWLIQMGYDLTEIEYVKGYVIHGQKTDVQIQISIKLKEIIDCQNIQVKLVSNPKGFNQIDKRWIDTYKQMWNIPDNITTTLKKYTGEIEPTIPNPTDPRRMFTYEFDYDENIEVINWFEDNKFLIISDIMKGRGKLTAEWILIVLKVADEIKYYLESINAAMNYFSQGQVTTTNQGNYKIGRITVQRKGGDGGKETAKMLQFKLNPTELINTK